MEDKTREKGGMEGTVSLEITGGQGEITTRSTGQCYLKNGHHYVLFQEEIAEEERSGKKEGLTFSSRLKIGPDQVTLRRTLPGKEGGPAKPMMEFVYRKQAEGEAGCFVDYPSPYGTLRLEIRTQELAIRRGDDEIVVYVRYVMLQEGQEVSRDALQIRVRAEESSIRDGE